MDPQFVASLPDSLVIEWEEVNQYRHTDDSYMDERSKEIAGKKKELEKLRSDLKIVKEQEAEISTEIEERNLDFWMTSLQNHSANLSSIQVVEEQLAAMKAKYERKKLFFEGRVAGAKEELERKKNKRSKPEIKFSLKIEELEKDINSYETAIKGAGRYRQVKEQIDKLFAKWKQEKYKKIAKSFSEEVQKEKSYEEEEEMEVPQKVSEQPPVKKEKKKPKQAVATPNLPKVEEKQESKYPPVIQNTKETLLNK